MLEAGEAIKYGQWQEAGKQLEALQRSLDAAFQRYVYFERLLGRPENEIKLPEFVALDTETLMALTLKATEPALDMQPTSISTSRRTPPLPPRASW